VMAVSDPRPTQEIVRCVRLRDQAQSYRNAAHDLLRLADEMEAEARDGAYIAHVAAEADAELSPMRGKRVAW
jgi:hypothetical protein